MTLRDALRAVQVPRMPRPDYRTRLKPVLHQLKKQYEDTEALLERRDVERIAGDFKLAAERGEWSGLSKSHWRDVIWFAFQGEHSLSSLPGFMDQLTGWYFGRLRRQNIRALIKAYVSSFDARSDAIKRIGKEISKVVDGWPWEWAELQKRYRLFDPSKAAELLGKAASQDDDAVQFLASLGFDGEKLNSGLIEAAFVASLNMIALGKDDPGRDHKALQRLLNWAGNGEELRYPRCKSQLADCILLPWNGSQAPEQTKQTILEFLIARIGDPRIDRHRWIGVSDGALRVMKRWLTQVALEQFFQVVDKVADEYMWRYRRAFWLAYHKKEVIDEAWVLFGPQARRYAMPAFEEKADAFGRLEAGPGVQPAHCVLLMKIGKLTVADWSHAGKCYIWSEGNKAAPTLYGTRYSRTDVISGSDNGGESHTSSDTLNWQKKVREYIRRRTGISVSEQEMTPARGR